MDKAKRLKCEDREDSEVALLGRSDGLSDMDSDELEGLVN